MSSRRPTPWAKAWLALLVVVVSLAEVPRVVTAVAAATNNEGEFDNSEGEFDANAPPPLPSTLVPSPSPGPGPVPATVVESNTTIVAGLCFVSPNHLTSLCLDYNGNLALQNESTRKVIWQTGKGRFKAESWMLNFHSSGVLEIVDYPLSRQTWSNQAVANLGTAPSTLHIRDDGDVAVFDSSTPPIMLWHTNTAGL